MLTAAGRRSQEDARLDFINQQPLSVETEQALLAAIHTALSAGMDGLMIADYQSLGVVTARVRRGLLELAGDHKKPFVVDSRERAGEFRQLILKPNDTEAARLFFPDRKIASVELADLSRAALQHNRQTGQPIIITLGEQGCLAVVNGETAQIPGVHVPAPVDTVGAGDAFLASFTAAIASGAHPFEAAGLANLSAAVTVAKIGVTGTASPAEILALYDVSDFEP
jgi:bifunctional ADP-heptose synthase (sugar kinase/adenylyltransferase)